MIHDYEVNKLEAIRRLVGGHVSGNVNGENPNYIDGQTAPSESDIDAELVKLQAEWDALAWKRSREENYPSIAELTVALYDTDDKSAVEAKRAAVKLKYPKPE